MILGSNPACPMAFPPDSWCKIQINYPDNLFRDMIFFDYPPKKMFLPVRLPPLLCGIFYVLTSLPGICR